MASQETSPINAWNITRASVDSLSSAHRRVHTRESTTTCDVCVGRGSDLGCSCVSIRGSTVGKGCVDAPSVGRTSIRAPTFLSIRGHTGEKPKNAVSAANVSVLTHSPGSPEAAHGEKKPYRCDEGGKGFSQSTHLHIH